MAQDSVSKIAIALAEIADQPEEVAKAELLAARTGVDAEKYIAFFASRRAASKSGSHRIDAAPPSQRHRRELTIGHAVLRVCDSWLTPDEIVVAVGRIRPGTNDASVYPEIKRLKDVKKLALRDGRYKRA